MTEPTPVYGLVQQTRKPAVRSASELSQAVTALEHHHAEEAQAFAENAGSLTGAINADPNALFSDGQTYAWHNMRLEGIASELRSDRHALLEQLLPLREPFAAIVVEGQSLLPENALFAVDVEPGPLEPAPKPIMGLELTLPEELNVLHETLQWSQRNSRALALSAIGPCYGLFVVIEAPSSKAMGLHHKLDALRKALLKFVLR
jgi:hypothetical protein